MSQPQLFSDYNVYPASRLYQEVTWVVGGQGYAGQASAVQLMNAGLHLQPMLSAELTSPDFLALETRSLTSTNIFPPPKQIWADCSWTGWYAPKFLSDAWLANPSFFNTPLIACIKIEGNIRAPRRCARILGTKMLEKYLVAVKLEIRLNQYEVEAFTKTRVGIDEQKWVERVVLEVHPVEYSMDFIESDGTVSHIRSHYPVSQDGVREAVHWTRCQDCEAGNPRLVRITVSFFEL